VCSSPHGTRFVRQKIAVTVIIAVAGSIAVVIVVRRQYRRQAICICNRTCVRQRNALCGVDWVVSRWLSCSFPFSVIPVFHLSFNSSAAACWFASQFSARSFPLASSRVLRFVLFCCVSVRFGHFGSSIQLIDLVCVLYSFSLVTLSFSFLLALGRRLVMPTFVASLALRVSWFMLFIGRRSYRSKGFCSSAAESGRQTFGRKDG